MVLKKLGKKDIRGIIDLHRKAIFPLWKRLKREYNIKEIEEYAGLSFKKGQVFGYFKNNELIGCAGIVLDKKNNVGEVRHVLVAPEFQGKGIGKKLMKEVEIHARKNKIEKLKLDVLIKNKAVKFYEKLGYKNYAYIMQKKLKC